MTHKNIQSELISSKDFIKVLKNIPFRNQKENNNICEINLVKLKNMTPKSKALELYNKFISFTDVDISESKVKVYNTKQSALIAVDEILDAICFNMCDEDEWNKENEYWYEVIKEIEKL